MQSLAKKIMGAEKRNTAKDNYFWFSLGSGTFAMFSLISTIFLTRLSGELIGGMFSIGLSISQMMSKIGSLEIRTYQVTDTKNEYKFTDYFTLRGIMCLLDFIIAGIYIYFQQYTMEKVYIILLLCVFKNVEAIADIFEGNFQKNGRVDMAGRSMCYRTLGCMATLLGVQYLCRNILLSLAMMNIVAVTCVVLLNVSVVKEKKFVCIEGKKSFHYLQSVYH